MTRAIVKEACMQNDASRCYFQLTAILATFHSMAVHFLKRFGKKLDLSGTLAKLWSNKKLSAVVAAAFVILLYVLFNSQGVLHRMSLERQKKEIELKIQQAEQEQKQLQDQSKALDGDKKAVEKVAREKYGMVREGEKVYRVAPKK